MHRKTTENAVFTRNFEFIDPLRSFDRNMVFNYTNLTIRKGLIICGTIVKIIVAADQYDFIPRFNLSGSNSPQLAAGSLIEKKRFLYLKKDKIYEDK